MTGIDGVEHAESVDEDPLPENVRQKTDYQESFAFSPRSGKTDSYV